MTDPSLVPDETRALIERLASSGERTLMGDGDADDRVRLDSVDGSMTIRSVDADGQQPFEFNVLDAGGVAVENVTSLTMNTPQASHRT